MLSGETAKGKYPLAAVEVMNKIAKKVDATIPPFYVEGVITVSYTHLIGYSSYKNNKSQYYCHK